MLRSEGKKRCQNWIGPYQCTSTNARLWYEEGIRKGLFCDFCMVSIQKEFELRKLSTVGNRS